MNRIVVALPILILAACSSDAEPERPSEADEARFEEIEAMLDEEATRDEGAAPEDTAP